MDCSHTVALAKFSIKLTFNLLLIEIQQMTVVFIYGVREYDFYKQNKTLHCTPDFVTTFIYKAIANIQYIFYAMETIRIPYFFCTCGIEEFAQLCVFFPFISKIYHKRQVCAYVNGESKSFAMTIVS